MTLDPRLWTVPPLKTNHWCDWFPCTRAAVVVISMGYRQDEAYLCEQHAGEFDNMILLYRKANRDLREGVSGSGWDLPKAGVAAARVKTTALDETLCQCGHPAPAHYLGVFRGHGEDSSGGCHACNAAGTKCANFKMGYQTPSDPQTAADAEVEPGQAPGHAEWTDQ